MAYLKTNRGGLRYPPGGRPAAPPTRLIRVDADIADQLAAISKAWRGHDKHAFIMALSELSRRQSEMESEQ